MNRTFIKPCIRFLPGSGFNIRNPADRDVDDDLDIEGADEDEFGEVQFDEGDIIMSESHSQGDVIDVGVNNELDMPAPSPHLPNDVTPGKPARARTLRDLVAEGKVSRNGLPDVLVGKRKSVDGSQAIDVRNAQSLSNTEDLNISVEAAALAGDKDALISALQTKLHNLVRQHSIGSCLIYSDQTSLCRNLCPTILPIHPRSRTRQLHVAFVLSLTRIRHAPSLAGTYSATAAGYDVWERRNYVLYVSISRRHPI